MRKLSHSRRDSVNDQITKIAKAPPFGLKLPTTTLRHSRNLSDSFLSSKSANHSQGTGFKLPASFYNDRSKIYQKRSRVLSERSTSFQSKPISFSQRKRFESQLTESIVQKHSHLKSMQSTQNLTAHSDRRQGAEASELIKQRYQDVMRNKYKKLVLGETMIKVNKNILERTVKRSLSEKVIQKWKSPFLKGNSVRQQFEGESILPRKVEKIYGNGNASQLKVLNLDRLFRVKNGKLGNVVPLPIAKFSEVLTRTNMTKSIKNKDKIHYIIAQYNQLLKLMQLKKTHPRLGVKGKNFTKNPTIEELMGIKMNPSKQQLFPQNQLLDEDVFVNHCEYYVRHIKKNAQLTRRLISGLTQDQPHKNMSLSSFTRFYTLFVTKIAAVREKIDFLVYFFVPQGQDKIQFSALKLILRLMCEELPEIGELDVRTDLISREEKSKIFLEALNRVLFSHLQSESSLAAGLSRAMLKLILESNPDASDLMIRLLQME